MASRTTYREWQVAEAAALAAVGLSPLAEASLGTMVEKVLGAGEPVPALQPVQETVSRIITISANRLLELEDHYAQAQLAERLLRDALRSKAVKLRLELSQARALLRQLFGPGKGLSIVSPRLNLGATGPKGLARIGRQLVDALREPGFELPIPAEAVANISRPEPWALADAVEQALSPVEALLVVNSPSHQQTEIGKGARDLERAELRNRVRRCLRFLEGIYQLTHLDYHAERLRAVARRRKPPVSSEEVLSADVAGLPTPVQGAEDGSSAPTAQGVLYFPRQQRKRKRRKML